MHSYQTSKNNQHIKNVMQRDRKLTIPSKVRTCSSTGKKKKHSKNRIQSAFYSTPAPPPSEKKKESQRWNFFCHAYIPNHAQCNTGYTLSINSISKRSLIERNK